MARVVAYIAEIIVLLFVLLNSPSLLIKEEIMMGRVFILGLFLRVAALFLMPLKKL